MILIFFSNLYLLNKLSISHLTQLMLSLAAGGEIIHLALALFSLIIHSYALSRPTFAPVGSLFWLGSLQF